MGVHSQLFAIPAAGGTPKALTTGNHAIGGWTYVAGRDRHVFTKDDPARRRHLDDDDGRPGRR